MQTSPKRSKLSRILTGERNLVQLAGRPEFVPIYSTRKKDSIPESSPPRERPLKSQNLQARQPRTPWRIFELNVKNVLYLVEKEFEANLQQTAASLEITKQDVQKRWVDFLESIDTAISNAREKGMIDRRSNAVFHRLWETFLTKGNLHQDVKFLFFDTVISQRFSQNEVKIQQKMADCRFPSEWFPATRAMQRKIILHVGPTNSGKTYHALKRLEEAESGIFAGPLRLLAHEVYTRFNAKGKRCSLITGEEQRIPDGLTKVMSSCTVEMVPLNTKVDVAVIDEIQMMGNETRGWAWTQAFLGVQAKEVHLCGEPRTVPLIKDLCAYNGESLEIHEYVRLGPLSTEVKSLGGNISNLRKGDALVVFSRKHIHFMKKIIEGKHPGKRCAIVYGSLPPEVRAQQAELFNDPDNNVDFLCASDAIGMGLNLSIKRVVFASMAKFDGRAMNMLQAAHTKQIAGRAGRFKTAHQAMQDAQAGDLVSTKLGGKRPDPAAGTVTTLDHCDLRSLQWAMKQNLEPIKVALCFPPSDSLVAFASFFPPETPFSYILIKFQDMTAFNPRFKHASYEDLIIIADAIQEYDLTIRERLTFCSAPAKLSPENLPILKHFAKCVADKSGGALLDTPLLPFELLDEEKLDTQCLRDLETLHLNLTTYLWLSYRFHNIFTSRMLAFHVSDLVEQRIQKCLDQVPGNERKLKQLQLKKSRKLQMQEEEGFDAVSGDQASAERMLNEDDVGEMLEEPVEREVEDFEDSAGGPVKDM